METEAEQDCVAAPLGGIVLNASWLRKACAGEQEMPAQTLHGVPTSHDPQGRDRHTIALAHTNLDPWGQRKGMGTLG